ncbi:hypothetical protein BTN82_09545 [Pseudomonas chlororaphis]|uniref:Uncharacterized protein n=1 Tax=Pseudomonas chlororaphis TaxID=587753 RepID=A0A1Q8ETV4_9PSED|nr:hypothetical protein BTN82_09545 [Pseudomonas chlororaphis]
MGFDLGNSERSNLVHRVEIKHQIVPYNEAAIRRARNHYLALVQRHLATVMMEAVSFDADRRTAVRKKYRKNLLAH